MVSSFHTIFCVSKTTLECLIGKKLTFTTLYTATEIPSEKTCPNREPLPGRKADKPPSTSTVHKLNTSAPQLDYSPPIRKCSKSVQEGRGEHLSCFATRYVQSVYQSTAAAVACSARWVFGNKTRKHIFHIELQQQQLACQDASLPANQPGAHLLTFPTGKQHKPLVSLVLVVVLRSRFCPTITSQITKHPPEPSSTATILTRSVLHMWKQL